MMSAGVILLSVSLLSFAVYACSLTTLLVQPVRKGLVRTAVCRVVSALIYLTIALITLRGIDLGSVALFVFIGIQLMWQGNAVADARLRRSRHSARRE
jgi:hypothetical protein